MSAFWNAEDKIPVRQTKVAIPAENGLDFQANGRINITIPPTLKFFQPKETYLSFDYLIGHTGSSSKLQLDAELGGQVLIRDIRIFSGGAGAVLLEEIQNYNVITAIRYDYEADATLRNKRALTEGATTWSNNTRGTRGNQRTDLANVTHNPNTAPYESAVAYTSANDAAAQRKVKCLLPLHTGLFQNDKVFPSLLTDGLRIEIQLESAPRCLRVNDMTNPFRHNQHACLFHSATSSGGTSWVADAGGKDDSVDNAVGTTGGIYTGYTITHVWVRRDNNQIGLENFPLSVGETFNIIRNNKNPVTNHGQTATGGSFDAPLVVSGLDWVVGGGAGVAGGTYGLVRITLSGTRTFTKATGGSGETILGGSGGWSIVSTDMQGLGGNDNNDWTTTPTITVSDVELIVQQLEMPEGYTRKMMSMMKAGGTLNYDFLSATNYKYSQLAGDVVANIRLPLSQSRAKSIISVPTDSSVYTQGQQIMGYKTGVLDGATQMKYLTPYDAAFFTYQLRPTDLLVNEEDGAALTNIYEYTENNLYSVRSGIAGIWDHMSHYQWFYNGQLNPSRRVETAKIANKRSITQQPLIENEKALAMAGIRPLSFRKFNENAFVGRALALQNGVYDTRGKDFNLQVSYEESDAPVKNKLWNNFVFHVRRLSVKGNQISVVV